ncbi:biotin/lipoyl-binding protein [Arsenophonus sp.]|uniref:biotin/lipoyl-binding protein n=1 Tax=Arsenophonus sp. TaxID=1872640 RepID=UPI00387A07F4
MKKNLRLLSIAIICLLIVIIVAGYYYYQTYQNKTLILYGNVDIRTVNLSFRVNGKLQTLNVDEGDKISAGQILASLDNTPYQNSLQRATGILASAKAKLDMLENGYRSQEIAQVEAEVAQRQAAWKYANLSSE